MSPAGDTLVVVTSLGIFAYEFPSLIQEWQVPSPDTTRALFSPDGRFLTTISSGKGLEVRQAEDGLLLDAMTVPGEFTWSVEYSPAGEEILAGTSSGDIFAWDAVDHTLLYRLNSGPSGIVDLAYSPDGRYLAAASYEGPIALWGAESRQLVRTLEGHEFFTASIAFSPDGNLLASGGFGPEVKVWQIASGHLTSTLVTDATFVDRVAFHPSGAILAASGNDGFALMWQLPSGNRLATIPADADYPLLLFDPMERFLIATDRQANPVLYDADTLVAVSGLEGFTKSHGALASDPSSSILASCTDDLSHTVEVQLWNAPDPARLLPLLTARVSNTRSGSPWAVAGCALVALGDDASAIVAAQTDGAITSWNDRMAQPKALASPVLSQCYFTFAFARTPDILVARTCEGLIEVYNAREGTKEWQFLGEDYSSLAFSPDGLMLAAGTHAGRVQLIDTSLHEVIRELPPATDSVDALAFSPDAEFLVSVLHDGSLAVWRTPTWGTPIRIPGRLSAPVSIAVSAPPHIVGVGYLDGHALILSPDGSLLADYEAALDDPIYGIAFLAQGTVLATASTNGAILLWPVPALPSP